MTSQLCPTRGIQSPLPQTAMKGPLVLAIAFCWVIIVCTSFASMQINNKFESLGAKQLNNVISVAIRNGRNAGDFKTIEPSQILPPPTMTKCVRELNEVDVSKPSSFQGALARVYNTGVLRIGVTTINDPSVFFINETTGVAQGYNADVGRLVTNHMGLILDKEIRPSFVVYNFTSFFSDTLLFLKNSGEVDTVLDCRFLPARIPFADFTCDYSDSYSFAVFRYAFTALPAGVPPPSRLNDLNRHEIRVAVVPGTSYEAAVKKFLPLAQIVYFNKDKDAFDAVGKAADITFYELDNVAVYNQQNANQLVLVKGTELQILGGQSFITMK